MSKKRLVWMWIVSVLCVSQLHGQDIKINEIMASNVQTILDEDGESADWIELYNAGSIEVNLEGFSLTDDATNETPWTFPAYTMIPGQHLLIFASDKNRTEPPMSWETVVDLGDEWQYMIPTSEPDAAWRETGFDDGSWLTGKTSIGYGDGDDSTIVDQVISVFLRKKIDIADVDQISEILLHVDYDDGFVAYLNGTEIARRGLSGDIPAYNATAENHDAQMYQGGQPDAFPISDITGLLNEGENVLCVQVHNTNSTSSDMTIIPMLSLGSAVDRGGSISEYLTFAQASFHADFKISTDGDTLMLFNASQQMIDSVFSGNLTADVSFGRSPDGGADWLYFDEATPGKSNADDGFASFSGDVVFSVEGGLYSSSLQVELSTNDTEGTIYYTTDGYRPTFESQIYSGPIAVSSNTNLQARVLDANSIAGKIKAASYLIGVNHDLPVVSLTVDPYEFFDERNGMYMMGPNAETGTPHFGANFWQDWERQVYVEMYESNGDLAFAANAGAKIFGAYSRANAQKSLSLFFRKAYGDGAITYNLFPDKNLKEYSSFVLRNSGNDWNNTMMRDGLMTSFFHESVDRQAYRPAVLYINGEYYGIQNLREKINEHYIANNHDIDPQDVSIVETNTVPVHGDEQHYRDLIAYLQSNDLSQTDKYEYVADRVDIMNYIYYMSGNIFINNTDWPGNNIKFWREDSETGKWRWIAFDTDFGFGIWDRNDYQENTLEFALNPYGSDWPNPAWSTLLFRKLMGNTKFKNLFINTYVDQLNTVWQSDVLHDAIDEKSGAIAGEIQDHMSRWWGNYGSWLGKIDDYHYYADNRPARARQHIVDYFSLSGTFDLTVNVSGNSHGRVRVNTLTPNSFPWTANYMDNIPVELEAIPKPGFEFVGWIGVTSSSNIAYVSATDDTTVRAVFERTGDGGASVVVNEINYNSSDEADIADWVELYNPGETALNVSGWVLKDDDDTHAFVFPNNTTIAGNGFLVIGSDEENFMESYSGVSNYIGDMDFGLSSSGDCVRVFDKNGTLVAGVCYTSESPWPDADGNGSTLALKNPAFDPTKPENWYASTIQSGNPGATNENTALDVTESENVFSLSSYPNPFHESLILEFFAASPNVRINVYDMQGRSVFEVVKTQSVGIHLLEWKPSAEIRKGMYFVRLVSDAGTQVQRVIYQ